jgi:preprotein translocase subunit SecF
MQLRIIETLKYLLFEYRFYISSIALLLTLLIYSYNKTLVLEKELVRRNKELHVNQVTFERRQKTYDEKMKQQHEEIERMIKEVSSHK